MAKRLNNLTGKDWLRYSFSIWRDVSKNKEEFKLKHPAMYPIQLAERLIEIFTDSTDQMILDPFMGSGSTLIAAQNMQRKSVGFDTNKKYIKMARDRLCNEYKNFETKKDNATLINDSSLNINKHIADESIDLTITSPPYWDILNRKRTADRKEVRSYGNLKSDIGNITAYKDFLDSLKAIFANVYDVTKFGGYCIVIVMDIRKKSIFFPLHLDVSDLMKDINFRLCDIVIWDRQKEYNSMRPLGYPYSFVVNKVHEYILIFKKDKKK